MSKVVWSNERRQKMAKKAKEQFSTHGQTKTMLYRVYARMKQRCYDEKDKNFSVYGAKGIKVCEEWLNDYMNFYNWAITNGYKEEKLPNGKNKWTIDRIDPKGDYEPDNCRWVTQYEQTRNMSTNRYFEYNGQSHILPDWSKILGIKFSTLAMRIYKYKWSVEKAFSTPSGGV